MKHTLVTVMKITLLFLSLALLSLPVIAQNNNKVDTAVIERITGMKGKANNGEYKITVPQNDLSVMVDSFKIIPYSRY